MAEKTAVDRSPLRIRLDITLEVDVDDSAELTRQAVSSVANADFTDESERQTWHELVVSSPAEALAWLAKPANAVNVPGVSPVSAEYGTEIVTTTTASTPDFAALFPECACGGTSTADVDDVDDYCEDCSGWALTPNTAVCLYTALDMLVDQLRADLEEQGDEPCTPDTRWRWAAFDRLPRTSWSMDRRWRERFVQACLDLQSDLASGQLPSPKCNAEEIALHLAIDDAEAVQELGLTTIYASRKDDYNWTLCSTGSSRTTTSS